jgi:predicted metal-dependent phosphotriesterase family hydrolase
MVHVQTVLGPVDPALLGRVLSHEHLLALTPGPWLTPGGDDEFTQERVTLAVRALAGLADYGVDTVVDLSPYGDAGRDATGANVALLQEVSRRSRVHIVAGTATYRAEFSPRWILDIGLDDLTRRFIADATQGIGETGIRAGILGEQPAGLDVLTPHEEKGLRAAARAHHATGLSVNTHTTHGTMALEQIAILREEGVDPGRVVIGHMDNHPDLDYVRRVLDRGVNIAFDSIGKQFWDVRTPGLPADHPDGPYTKDAVQQSDRTRADRIAELVADGYATRILLSQDLTGGQVYLNTATHGQWGYRYLFAVFAGLLTERGVAPEHIEAMTSANPLRLLTIA